MDDSGKGDRAFYDTLDSVSGRWIMDKGWDNTNEG